MLHKKWLGKQVGIYRLIDILGEGRYGVCFLATNPENVPVAIKYFKPKFWQNYKDKHEYEAVILSQINHPAIPSLLGVINERKFYGFVLELMPGITIEKLLFEHHRQFSNDEIYHIGAQLIDILRYLHERDIVHRDVRIANILLHENKISLIDFGLARFVNQKRYRFDYDFSYLGDFLLFLHYSTFTKKTRKNRPWYKELDLTPLQIQFYKKLLRLEKPYTSIDEVAVAFHHAFNHK